MRSVLRVAALAVALGALTGCRQVAVQRAGAAAASSPHFEATFDSPADFFDRFDFGYSGQDSWNFPDGIKTFHGDHSMSCGGPDTSRDVVLSGTGPTADVSQLFWYCAPKGPPSGHIMTGVVTVGYNIAWFSPKPTFTAVTKVCWDINETEMSHRKWTQVLFVSQADATRYPAGTATVSGGVPAVARGTGGFDLGYTAPDFRDVTGPSAGILPQGGTLAGVKMEQNAPSWFQDQDNFTTRFEGPGNILNGVTDKAARYQHCLENQPNNIVRLTQQTPDGTRTFDMAGQIPQGPVRVVFQDDNYNGPKDASYNPDVNTWHWDNIEIQSGSAMELAAPMHAEAVAAPTGSSVGRAVIPPVPAAGEELGHGGGGAITVGNIVGLGGTVAALALLLVLWSARSRRELS